VADWTTPVAQLFSGQKIPRYLHGTIPPMATPCNADHTLDEEGIRAYTDFLIERQKADTLFVRTVERDRLGPELSALRGTKGRPVQPYTKTPVRPITAEQMNHMEHALDVLRAPYLR